MRCEDLPRHLVRTADLEQLDAELPPEVAGHVQHCLRCQVETLRHRRLARSLRQLQERVVEPSPDLVVDILAWIDEAEAAAEGRAPRYRLAAYLAAAATAATAAGAAGALVIAARSRRGRLGLAG